MKQTPQEQIAALEAILNEEQNWWDWDGKAVQVIWIAEEYKTKLQLREVYNVNELDTEDPAAPICLEVRDLAGTYYIWPCINSVRFKVV